jgi:hypothetical protein
MKTFKYATMAMLSTFYLVPMYLYTEEAKKALEKIEQGEIGDIIEFTFKEQAALIAILDNIDVIRIS